MESALQQALLQQQVALGLKADNKNQSTSLQNQMHTMLQGNHNLSALMQQHHLLSNSNHNQFGFSSGASQAAQ
jgi:hypothetical protein